MFLVEKNNSTPSRKDYINTCESVCIRHPFTIYSLSSIHLPYKDKADYDGDQIPSDRISIDVGNV